MKHFHSLSCRIFLKSDDDYIHYKEFLVNFLEELGKGLGSLLEEELVSGLYDQKIVVFRFKLSKDKLVKDFLTLVSDCDGLFEDYEEVIDESCNYYFRLKKEDFFENKFFLTTGGNCVHFTLNIASYPKSKSVALKVFEDYLNENNYK